MEKETIAFQAPETACRIASLQMSSDATYRGMHTHDAVEIVWVKNGTLPCRVANRTYTLCAGDVLIINRNVVHALESADADIVYVQMDVRRHLPHFSSTPEQYGYAYMSGYRASPQILLVGGGDVADVLSKLETEYNAQNAFCKQFMNAYLSLLVAFLYRYELLLPHDTLADSALEPLLPVLHFLHEQISNSSLTLDAICAATNYDKFYLCRLFKKITGGTVFQYLNYLRVAVAADLLAEGGKTVTQVAMECGFSSVQYFNRVFKKERGCTPSVYKQSTK